MPFAKNPEKPEFYVYRLTADGVPFYVGVGRSGRASLRVGFVRNQMRREQEGRTAKWSLSTRVIAGLIASNRHIQVDFAASNLSRDEASRQERREIDALLATVRVLANIQHNPLRPRSRHEVVLAVDAAIARESQQASADHSAILLANAGGSDTGASAAPRRRSALR